MVNKLIETKKPFFWLANGLLAVCCLLCLGLTLMNWLYQPQIEVDKGGVIANATARPLTWRWFSSAGGNDAETRGQQQTMVAEELDEAGVDASLIGVLISSQDAYATLRMSSQGEKVFRLGDEIDDGIELIGIEPYRIIVEQRGRRMQVSMEKVENRMRSASSTAKGPLAPSAGSAAVPGFNLGDMVTAAPVDVEGYEGGFKLDSISGELGELAGLQQGDVVVEVAGGSIQALMDNPGQWVNLGANSQLPVTIMRDGQQQTIYVDAPALYSRLMPVLGQKVGNQE